MKKTIICFTLLFLLCFIAVTPAFATVNGDPGQIFNDVKQQSWYFAAVNEISNQGVLVGTGNGNFSPEVVVTRAQFATAIAKLLNLELSDIERFDDVKSSGWYSKYVGAIINSGIMSGYSKSLFGPNDSITREQASVLIVKAYQVMMNSSLLNSTALPFVDKDNMSAWAVEFISKAYQSDLMKGKGSGVFAPQADLSRAEMATLIYNLTKRNPKMQIEMESGGKMTFELYPAYAPATVKNFVKLANEGFYNGLAFHRIIKGFMIQGGDPSGDGTGGAEEKIIGEFIENGYLKNLIKHTRGVISMARAQDPNSASSQFFIMHAEEQFLDGKYAAFGRMIDGDSVLEELASTAVLFNPQSGEFSAPENIENTKLDQSMYTKNLPCHDAPPVHWLSNGGMGYSWDFINFL